MKAFMKTSLLFLILCCALQLTSAYPVSDLLAKSICCFSEVSAIPLQRLDSYFWTSEICPLKHIVFLTTKKKQLCGNPENPWVKRAINHIDKKSPSKPAN